MLVGDSLFAVLQYKGNVQCVSRSPYSSFAIYESFQSLLNIFSSYIESADGLFFTVYDTHIRLLLFRFCHDNERYALRSDFNEPVSIGLSLSYGL